MLWHVVGTACGWVVWFVCGWLTATCVYHRRVFGPWLVSITPGEPQFWLRMRDWSAAHSAFSRASYMPKTRMMRRHAEVAFTDDPEGPLDAFLRVMS